MKKTKKEKRLFKRTFGIFTKFKIPIPLYILQVLLGIASTKVALLYVPYETDLKLGNIEDNLVLFSFIGLMLLSVVMGIIENIPEFYAESMVTRSLQNKLIHRSIRLPMKSVEKNASQIVSWITMDCTLANGLLTSIVGFLTGIVSVYMSVSTMSAIDSSMIYIVVIIGVYIIFSAWLEGKLMFLRERRGRKASARLMAYFAEHLSYFTEIKQLHSQNEELERGNSAIEEFYKADIYQANLTFINGFLSGSITNIISILVFILGVKRVNDGTMTITELAAFQSYMLIAYQSISSFPGFYTSLMYYNGQLYYIASLMAEEEEVYQREYPLGDETEDIQFENASFCYNEKEIIKSASFTIPKGRFTVVVGPNGSGKTTLFRLIERLYPLDDGKILFGDLDAEDINLDDWRRKTAYVFQNPQLFNASIRENIAYGMDREVTDEEIKKAASLADAEEFINEFDEGYDFIIGENGAHLSAGQRQRLAIARAVMLGPSYLLLDEATCNMDVYSEKNVIKGLLRFMEGRTTVMISHDMRMIDIADHIIVLNDGKVEAEGTKEEVINKSQIIKKLISA